MHFLIKLVKAKYVLEIGTSNGYSTLWLGSAVRENNGVVKTVEYSDFKANMAKENFKRGQLEGYIKQFVQDAGDYLDNEHNEIADFIFLDSDRKQYTQWWENICRVLKIGGLLVVDNVISHETELVDFIKSVENRPGLDVIKLSVGTGLLLIKKKDK